MANGDLLFGGDKSEEDTLREKLLISGIADSDIQKAFQQTQQLSKSIVPTSGFCLKTKNDKNEKVFINICSSDQLPAAKEITDEELVALLESEDPTGYRVPMSLGEAHAEVDKSSKGCTAYDVIVHPDFLLAAKERQILLGFFITIVLEGLEAKNNISLDRGWKILKNRRCVGTLQPQNIRTQSKPWIMEMDESAAQQSEKPKKSLISEVTKSESSLPRAPEPPYYIIQEPAEGHPEYLVAEVHLPKVKTASTVTLDIGEDRLLLQTRSNVYFLDIYLPFNLVQDECAAQFDKNTKVLTLTLPVQPK